MHNSSSDVELIRARLAQRRDTTPKRNPPPAPQTHPRVARMRRIRDVAARLLAEKALQTEYDAAMFAEDLADLAGPDSQLVAGRLLNAEIITDGGRQFLIGLALRGDDVVAVHAPIAGALSCDWF